MKYTFLLFLVLLFGLTSYGQSFKHMTISKADGTQIKASGKFIYEDGLIKKIRLKNYKDGSDILNIDGIVKMTDGETTFLIKTFEEKKYLLEQILSGKISIYKGKNNYYIENNIYGLKRIRQKEFTSNTVFIAGSVSLFFNKCKEAVNQLQLYSSSLTIRKLKRVIELFNTCNLDTEIQIADEIIEEGFKRKETVDFGLSLGYMNLKTNYSNLLHGVSLNNSGLPSIGAKVYFHSNILNDKLDFIISIDYFIDKVNIDTGQDFKVESKNGFTNVTIGNNYIFSNLSNTIKPYIGISGGFIYKKRSYAEIYSKDLGPDKITTYKTNNYFSYFINAGAVFNILNQQIDLLIEYYPSKKLTISNYEDILTTNMHYTVTGLNFKLSYLF